MAIPRLYPNCAVSLLVGFNSNEFEMPQIVRSVRSRNWDRRCPEHHVAWNCLKKNADHDSVPETRLDCLVMKRLYARVDGMTTSAPTLPRGSFLGNWQRLSSCNWLNRHLAARAASAVWCACPPRPSPLVETLFQLLAGAGLPCLGTLKTRLDRCVISAIVNSLLP